MQLDFVAPYLGAVAVATIFVDVVFALTGAFGLQQAIFGFLWAVCMILVGFPFFQPKEISTFKTHQQKEAWSFYWFLVFILLLHLTVTVDTTERKEARGMPACLQHHQQGSVGWLIKMILVSIQFSRVHFWILNAFAVAVGLFTAGVAGSFRGIVSRTLVKEIQTAKRALELHKQTEDAKQRFLAYIMHELRNPLNAAMMALVEFEAIHSELLTSTEIRQIAGPGGGGGG
eukprot:Cvel_24975.t1-p1 / transcript=Cvel_24975.t1 / gene=Cvel_24975 / organism=Chromera_velia_CCMP2878 / gene_product=hypothetical protein / transcript_product=hypothetical protein / location=Cvel_scaffold2767:1-891(-) / protein_length=229 / sequence_SO=supercontig / SO=protein_coding / is_pseudo=false